MALLGLYVGIVPVFLGMLFLPWLRRIGERWVACSWRSRPACSCGWRSTRRSRPSSCQDRATGVRGPGAGVPRRRPRLPDAQRIEAWVRSRRQAAESEHQSSVRLALLIAVGIGLHNLGEGLAIGSAYALGPFPSAPSWSSASCCKTTEGLAIIVPFTHHSASVGRLATLGAIAGAPAIAGPGWAGRPTTTAWLPCCSARARGGSPGHPAARAHDP